MCSIWYTLSLQTKSRLSAITGVLDASLLGMEESTYMALAAATDAIIHCAAAANHVSPYSAHRAANVTGTRNLLQLCVASSATAAFHFISTASVILSNKAPIVKETDPVQVCEAALNSNGYTQSKLVSEVLCLNASNHGLPLAVYRPDIMH